MPPQKQPPQQVLLITAEGEYLLCNVICRYKNDKPTNHTHLRKFYQLQGADVIDVQSVPADVLDTFPPCTGGTQGG